ncbi:MAG: hypothetical protein AVDCRST_MAG76-3806 [uncultured Acidimicrobiales bacterium]|uniref:4Fe-4S ferredoxin-type domain-containing protein n=1 Tax=uncultured Acidimicrobiales bacterium TaxID=310071 RepID=A0A6J4JEC1_9ACTN|nr:MAG: hypothetical protein AVDCRST_MAG76-3806 [uncultured Acidimicrobiales bacterium]
MASLAAPPGSALESVRITAACTACGACLATCPEHALRRAPKRPSVDDRACTACWACIEICPAGAIVEVLGPSGPAERVVPGPGGPAERVVLGADGLAERAAR